MDYGNSTFTGSRSSLIMNYREIVMTGGDSLFELRSFDDYFAPGEYRPVERLNIYASATNVYASNRTMGLIDPQYRWIRFNNSPPRMYYLPFLSDPTFFQYRSTPWDSVPFVIPATNTDSQNTIML